MSKTNIFVLVCVAAAIVGIIWTIAGIVSPPAAQAQTLVELKNDNATCDLKVIVKADVLLAHPIEIHPDNNAMPGGYTAVDKDYFRLDQLIAATTEDSDKDILSRLKSPAPEHFVIGEILSYSLRVVEKSNCVRNPPQKPLPDAPQKN